VVVVDTPPSRNALDFLDAPRRLTGFLSNRIFRTLMMPARTGLRFMGVAAQALLKTLSKVAGADVVRDAVTFFQAFEGMEEGFRERAGRVRELLTQPETAFVLVASPRPDSVDEAIHFAGKLHESDMAVTALVVNRVQPRFLGSDRLASLDGLGADDPTLAGLVENLRGYSAAAERDERSYADLIERVAPAPVARVPLLNSDVHDLEGLGAVADALFEGRGPSAGPPPMPAEAPGRAG
jgi:anion-transporting  ArsA/GET3 family ATPase